MKKMAKGGEFKKKSKSEQSTTKKEELHPLYWPFNPSGPIY
jgi:hypothetical protein